MKKVMLVLMFLIFASNFVNAGFVGSFTGKVVDNMGEDFSNLSKDELIQLYEDNKDNISKDDIAQLYEENKDNIPEDVPIENFNLSDIPEDSFDLGLLTCTLIKGIYSESNFTGTEIPKEIPFKNEDFDIYIDNNFLFSLEIKDGKVGDLSCLESEKVTYEIFVTSDLILDVSMKQGKIDDPVQYYKDKRESRDILIKPHGLFKRLKLAIINFGLNFL